MSAQFVFNAQDICRTRLCAAASCESDAATGSALCDRCDKRRRAGATVPLHTTPPPKEPELHCCGCKKWLPDKHFALRGANETGSAPHRRGRRAECKPCEATRKSNWRQANREKVNRMARQRRATKGAES